MVEPAQISFESHRAFCGIVNYVSRPEQYWCLRDIKLLVLWWAVVSTCTFIHACDPHAGPSTRPCGTSFTGIFTTEVPVWFAVTWAWQQCWWHGCSEVRLFSPGSGQGIGLGCLVEAFGWHLLASLRRQTNLDSFSLKSFGGFAVFCLGRPRHFQVSIDSTVKTQCCIFWWPGSAMIEQALEMGVCCSRWQSHCRCVTDVSDCPHRPQ